MFNTTQDIFWFIAAISLGAFTVFICWAIYYLIVILRDSHKVVSFVKQKIEIADNILKLIKEKLERTSTHLTAISDNIFKIVSYFIDRQGNKKTKKKT